MTEKNQGNMMIVSQEHLGKKTFSLIPVTTDCPFVECMYLPDRKELAIISKVKKDTFHFFTKVDVQGDVVAAKKTRANGKTHAEERKQIETFYEYYLTSEKDILEFIKLFALNSEGFKISNYIEPVLKKV